MSFTKGPWPLTLKCRCAQKIVENLTFLNKIWSLFMYLLLCCLFLSVFLYICFNIYYPYRAVKYWRHFFRRNFADFQKKIKDTIVTKKFQLLLAFLMNISSLYLYSFWISDIWAGLSVMSEYRGISMLSLSGAHSIFIKIDGIYFFGIFLVFPLQKIMFPFFFLFFLLFLSRDSVSLLFSLFVSLPPSLSLSVFF